VPASHASSRDSASSADKIETPEKAHDGSTIVAEAGVPGKEFEGRPHLPHLIHEEAARAAEAGEALSVYVCGPVTMQNDVRNAVAAANLGILRGGKGGGAYLHTEHFSWA
jgi:hypothetical protein